jgi:hypothetical protein
MTARSPAACGTTHKPLDVTAATVLHRVLTRPREERARDALRSPPSTLRLNG